MSEKSQYQQACDLFNQALAMLSKSGSVASPEWNLHKGLGLIATALAQDIPAMQKRLAEIDSDVKSTR